VCKASASGRCTCGVKELNMAGDIYLTQEGYEKLVEELGYLKTTKRRALSKAVGKPGRMGYQ